MQKIKIKIKEHYKEIIHARTIKKKKETKKFKSS